MQSNHLVSLALLFALAFVAAVPYAAGQGNPFQYDNTIFTLRANGPCPCSPVSNCFIDSNSTHSPLGCLTTNTATTTFTLTGLLIVGGDYALSPTVPCSLNPYGSGSSTRWCYPKSDSTYDYTNIVECNGAPATIPWIVFDKVGGVYGDGIYNGDSITILNNLTGLYCGGSSWVVCNQASQSLATIYTIVF